MSFLDHVRLATAISRRKKRQERRRKIAEFIAKVGGIFAGHMLGTTWVGWIVVGFTLVAGVILIGKIL